jgi:hypothetical protein
MIFALILAAMGGKQLYLDQKFTGTVVRTSGVIDDLGETYG